MESHPYRSHTCAELGTLDVGREVRLAGWLHRKRDHGHLLFVDLRDHYGVTQIVAERGTAAFDVLDASRAETVLTARGQVTPRDPENVNPKLETGAIELVADEVEVLGPAGDLPFPVADGATPPEELRLRYRFVDLRRAAMHRNVVLRSQITQALRRRMSEAGFLEIATPILTASSPEGARDFLVPSRVHPGEFYALPQAPQQFKQLLMVSGFDRYFQIAPCFRDEDARADRSPGEFYQLDCELAFATQDDVFDALAPVLAGTFREFSAWETTPAPFPRIPYAEALACYGSDKPDLRNPLLWRDVSALFAGGAFRAFSEPLARGAVVRALRAPGAAAQSRSFFDRLVEHARDLGAPGLAYVLCGEPWRGPLARFLDDSARAELATRMDARPGDAVFFLCDEPTVLAPISASLRETIGARLELIEREAFRFCWVVDFPMFERDAETGELGFSHNPFSMPQGGLDALRATEPEDVVAYQFDLVCNGVELSSGAVRNHRADWLIAAFEIAGYDREEVETRFGGMLRALRCGAPPHAGVAPGLDRIVMLLADAPNLREVIAFPFAQNARDLMMGAPAPVHPAQLRALGIAIRS